MNTWELGNRQVLPTISKCWSNSSSLGAISLYGQHHQKLHQSTASCDFSLHLSCIANRMLHIFATADNHHYAKGVWQYVHMLMAYEQGSPEQAAVINRCRCLMGHAKKMCLSYFQLQCR